MGLISIEELKQRFKPTEYFTRSELANAFSLEPLFGRVAPNQITRDIQALYDHKLDRKPIPYDVAVELYLVRLHRTLLTNVEDARQVSKDALLEFIGKLDAMDEPMAAKWAYAEQFGGGKLHFDNVIVGAIKASRIKAMSGATINVSAVPA